MFFGLREMDVAGENLPCLVHEAAAFVEETAPVLVDDDPVRIHQHDRRGMLAARIDRLDMHAVPVARNAAPWSMAMRMPSPVSKRVPGEISLMVSPPGPKCARIIAALPWNPPEARTMASASSVVVTPSPD